MAKQGKFQELADGIVELVGSKSNVSYFTHCITRLRFNVKDKALVRADEIGSLPGVTGVQWAGDQFQVIIGTDVEDAYRLVCQTTGLGDEDAAPVADDSGTKRKLTPKALLNMFFDTISGCIVPIMPLMIGSGMVKVLLTILTKASILGLEDPTYVTLNFAADAAFYFLPVAIGVASAKKFGVNTAIGVLLGCILVHPTFVQMQADGNTGSVFGLPIMNTGYTYSIFPMIVTMWVCGYVERFFAKQSPRSIRSVVEPFGTVLVMIPVMLCATGPVGAFVGNLVIDCVMWFYNNTGFLGITLLCVFYPLLVSTGMHQALTPYVAQSFSSIGYDPILGAPQLVSNLNVGIATLAQSLKAKLDPDLRAEALSCSITAIIGGVTEPALFGITLKYRRVLMATMIGNLCGGLWCGFHQIFRYAYENGNVLGIAAYFGKDGNFENMVIGLVIGAVTTFVAGLILCEADPDGVSASKGGVEEDAADGVASAASEKAGAYAAAE